MQCYHAERSFEELCDRPDGGSHALLPWSEYERLRSVLDAARVGCKNIKLHSDPAAGYVADKILSKLDGEP